MLKSRLSALKSAPSAREWLSRYFARGDTPPGEMLEIFAVMAALAALLSPATDDWPRAASALAALAGLLGARGIYLREVERQRFDDWALLQRQIDKLAPPKESP